MSGDPINSSRFAAFLPKRVTRPLRARIFQIIRPLFVKGIDPNEDFNCIECGCPVLLRHLYCGPCARDLKNMDDL